MKRVGGARLPYLLFALALSLLLTPVAFAQEGGGDQIHAAAGIPYTLGDVFVGDGLGLIPEFHSDGTLVQTLDNTTGSSEQTGMCFDAAGNLFSTNFSNNSLSKFDNAGNLLVAHFGGPFNQDPESCVVDQAGDIYVGQADGTGDVLKFDASGNLLDTFAVAGEARGSDHIDLAGDQCTMFYTSEGALVKRFNVCTDTQLTDFATGLPAPCYSLRIRFGGDVMVACGQAVIHLGADGSVLSTFSAASLGLSGLFAMNLDPDGTTFWTIGFGQDTVVRANISDGSVVGSFTFTGVGGSNAGLAVFGEQRAAEGASINVIKTIAGETAPDAIFTVDVVCTPQSGPSTTQTVSFDSTGTPTGADSVKVPALSTCVIQEEGGSDATLTTYACTPADGLPASVCSTQDDRAVVTVDAGLAGPIASVEVTNEFEVLVAPRFTG